MTGKLLVVGARMQAQAGKENDLREALKALIGPARQEAGCAPRRAASGATQRAGRG
jgi:hypothetical protein